MPNALDGGDLRLMSGFVNRPPLSMIAQPRYRSMADLRGAKLGTTSLKEGTCHLMEKMMAAHGMHQPADFQFVMAGAHPQRWEALKAGTLDAAIQLVPFNYIAEESGFPNLGDVDEYVPDFLFCAVCTRMSWANENPDRVIGLLRALRRGVEALYEDPIGAAAVVLDQINIQPEHARRACKEFVARTSYPGTSPSPWRICCDARRNARRRDRQGRAAGRNAGVYGFEISECERRLRTALLAALLGAGSSTARPSRLSVPAAIIKLLCRAPEAGAVIA